MSVTKDEQRENDGKGKKRFTHLDVFRILGVAGVIFAHGADSYLTANVVYGQNWGLQVLMIITGIGWSMSRTSSGPYVQRLAVFFFLGTAINYIAWVLVPNPSNETLAATAGVGEVNLFNTIYQMWFAVGVSICVLLTAPMKWAFESGQRVAWKVSAGYSAIAVVQVALWWTGTWGHYMELLLNHIGGSYYSKYSSLTGFYVSQFWCSSALVTFLYALSSTYGGSSLPENGEVVQRHNKFTQFIAWCYIPCIYVPNIFVYEPLAAHLHFVQLFVLGMIVQKFSMFGQKELASFISSYWPLVMIWPIGMMSIPNAPHQRMDMFPLEAASDRARFEGIELVFTLAFVICGTPANPLDKDPPVEICRDPANMLSWLNRWALFAYMSHIFFLRLIPAPFGTITVYCTAAAFWAEEQLHRRARISKPLREAPNLAWTVLFIPCTVVLSLTSYAVGICFACVSFCLTAFLCRWMYKNGAIGLPDGSTPLKANEMTYP